jgi:hypothetical protein
VFVFSKKILSKKSSLQNSSNTAPAYMPSWMLRELRSDERLLLNFAAVDAVGCLDDTNATLEHITSLATLDGNAAFAEALASRQDALPCHEHTSRWLPVSGRGDDEADDAKSGDNILRELDALSGSATLSTRRTAPTPWSSRVSSGGGGYDDAALLCVPRRRFR